MDILQAVCSVNLVGSNCLVSTSDAGLLGDLRSVTFGLLSFGVLLAPFDDDVGAVSIVVVLS